MNNEKIIIDAVNVGQCKYLNTFTDCDGYHYYCDLADDIKNEYCEHYKNCYFKQLKHKEQECDKYENALDSIYQYIKTCICEYCISKKDECVGCYHQDFLDIINKAKDGKNEKIHL